MTDINGMPSTMEWNISDMLLHKGHPTTNMDFTIIAVMPAVTGSDMYVAGYRARDAAYVTWRAFLTRVGEGLKSYTKVAYESGQYSYGDGARTRAFVSLADRAGLEADCLT